MSAYDVLFGTPEFQAQLAAERDRQGDLPSGPAHTPPALAEARQGLPGSGPDRGGIAPGDGGGAGPGDAVELLLAIRRRRTELPDELRHSLKHINAEKLRDDRDGVLFERLRKMLCVLDGVEYVDPNAPPPPAPEGWAEWIEAVMSNQHKLRAEDKNFLMSADPSATTAPYMQRLADYVRGKCDSPPSFVGAGQPGQRWGFGPAW